MSRYKMNQASLIYQFPLPWQGLYSALVGPSNSLGNMNVWLKKVKRSCHGSRLSWDELITFLTSEEPVVEEGDHVRKSALLFVPVLLQFSPTSQNQLLSFLHQHRDEIPRAGLQILIQTITRDSAVQINKKSHQVMYSNTIKLEHVETSANSSDWLVFWAKKFQNYIEDSSHCSSPPRLTGGDSVDAYVFTSSGSEGKAKLLNRLGELRESRNMRKEKSSLWWCTIWDDEAKEVHGHFSNHAGSTEYQSTPHGSMNASMYLPLTQSHSQGVDGQDPDVSILYVTPGPDAKRRKLDVPDELSESRLGLAVGEKLQGAAQRMKDSWYRIPSDLVPSQDLNALAQCSLQELEVMCDYLDLPNLPESNLASVSDQVSSLKEQLALSHAATLTKSILLDRVLNLNVSESRNLHQACVSLSQAYISAVVQNVFVPVLKVQNPGAHQCEFIAKVIKDSYNDDERSKLFSSFLESESILAPAAIPLVHIIVAAKTPMDDKDVVSLVAMVSRSACGLQDNLKFGKLILDIVRVYDRQMNVALVSSLSQTADKHKTFLKKSITAAIKKIVVSSTVK